MDKPPIVSILVPHIVVKSKKVGFWKHQLKVWVPFQHFFYLEIVQKFWGILYFQAIGDQKKEGPDAKKRQRGKIICCANNTIDEVTKSLLVNWI